MSPGKYVTAAYYDAKMDAVWDIWHLLRNKNEMRTFADGVFFDSDSPVIVMYAGMREEIRDVTR